MVKLSALFNLIAMLCWTACFSPETHVNNQERQDYVVRVLILTEHTAEAEEISGHFRQSWNLTTEVSAMQQLPADAGPGDYDLIYVTGTFPAPSDPGPERIKRFLTAAARQGAIVYMETDILLFGMEEILGLSHTQAVEPEEACPVVTQFPPEFRSLESFFRGIIPGPAKSERGYYETTQLPNFVQTQPQDQTWPVHFHLQTPHSQTLIHTPAGEPLLTWRPMGNGGLIWSTDFSRRKELFHDVPVRRDFRLGFPDPEAANFHFGRAGIDYLFRDLLTDLAAKMKYGLSIRRVAGPNGAPACSWQNHLDAFDNWSAEYARRWSEILATKFQIPSFSVRSDLTRFDHPDRNIRREDAERFVRYCTGKGIPINLHLTLEPNDAADREMERITQDIARLTDLGVPEDQITGVNHHVFYSHAKPVWQSFHSILKAGLFHDFGGSTLSPFQLFPWFFCTSSAYRPYCPPFMLENITGTLAPLVIWSPTAVHPRSRFSEFRYGLPGALRMPVTEYIHPEFIRDAVTFEEMDPDLQKVVADQEQLRKVYGYCPVTEPQAARSFIAARTADISATLASDRIVVHADNSRVPPAAGPFARTLGVRVETVPHQRPVSSWSSSEFVRFAPLSGGVFETAIDPRGDTVISINAPATDAFSLERIHVPFTRNVQSDHVEIRIEEPGLRWLRYPVDRKRRTGWLPDPSLMTVRADDRCIEMAHTGVEPLTVTLRKYTGDAFHNTLYSLCNTFPVTAPDRELDFGTETTRERYGRGWSIVDENIQNRTVTWSSGYRFSELTVNLTGDARLSAALVVMPYERPSGDPQTISVWINAQEVLRETVLTPGWQTLRFPVPADVLIQGANQMEFRYGFTAIPGLDHSGIMDFRLLGVMFDRLILRPLPKKVVSDES